MKTINYYTGRSLSDPRGMTQPLSHTDFIFSDPIDSAYIIELYAGDYIMIEETFADALKEYDDYVGNINSSYSAGNITALKRAVHKIKPLFGFVGLTAIQAYCLHFENTCLDSSSAVLTEDFVCLKDHLLQARTIIETERRRLEEFNGGGLPGN